MIIFELTNTVLTSYIIVVNFTDSSFLPCFCAVQDILKCLDGLRFLS